MPLGMGNDPFTVPSGAFAQGPSVMMAVHPGASTHLITAAGLMMWHFS